MKVALRPAARADVLFLFRYYLIEQDEPEVADRFVAAVQRTVGAILRMPRAGAPRLLSNESLVGLRSWPVAGFESVRVYYLVAGGVVQVVRVLHGKRDIQAILEQEE